MNCHIDLHCWITCLFFHLSEMSLHGDDVIELILRIWKIEWEKKRDETREMEEQLKTDQAAMESKEKECLVLMRERDQMLALEKVTNKLVADFLEADSNNNFDAQKAMENEIEALMTTDGGGVNGEDIGYLMKTLSQNKDKRAGMATIEGEKEDDEE